MSSFDRFADEFADLVAEKVVALLAKQQGSDWPSTENKHNNVMPEIKWTSNALVDGKVVSEEEFNAVEDKVVTESEEEKVVEEEKPKTKVANSTQDKRREELLKADVRSLRRDIAAVEGKDKSDYGHLPKPKLVEDILALETVLGRTLQEEIDKSLEDSGVKTAPSTPEPVRPEPEEEEIPDDDTSVEEPADDDEEQPLTREAALELDLKTLKAIAIENDVDAEDLRGLDVDAIVALLYGAEETDRGVVDDTTEAKAEVDPVEEDADDDEEGDSYTADDFKQMSIAELREAADQINELGADIQYDRKTSREALLAEILEVLELEA